MFASLTAVAHSVRAKTVLPLWALVLTFLAQSNPCNAQGDWAWIKGSNTGDQPGVYGIKGVAAAENTPGARGGAVSWSDPSGNLWLFGGGGVGRWGDNIWHNDLWKFEPVSGNWTWVKGSNTGYEYGVYGTKGEAGEANTPSGRLFGAVSWSDTSGNLWLFGGNGYGEWGGRGDHNDLWKFDLESENWIWMKGSNLPDTAGVYGIKGVASVDNTPGARYSSATWTDVSGNLWLFGGRGRDGASLYSSSNLNDLWKFESATGNWTWVTGSNVGNQPGTYGMQGVPAEGNTPGARHSSVTWTDDSGDFWLFGGIGMSASVHGPLDDLWKFEPTSGNWTWVKGSNGPDHAASYGIQGEPDPSNTPGARYRAVSWSDYSGNFWLFGGYGPASFEWHNDLWKFDSVSGNWIWMKGSNAPNHAGTYGTQGLAEPGNAPSARDRAVSFIDTLGNLYLFGGLGVQVQLGVRDSYNDLWKLYMTPSVTGNPTMLTGALSGARSIDVTFSEAMVSSVTLATNYTVSGGGQGTLSDSPDSVIWVTGNTYRLHWDAGEMSGGASITVTVSPALTDSTGEAMGSPNSVTLSTAFIPRVTDTGFEDWLASGQDSGPENPFDPGSVDDVDVTSGPGVLQVVVGAAPENGGRQRIAGWYNDNIFSADAVGPDKWIRGKFYVYTNRPFSDNLNTVSNFRIRLQNEGAVTGGMNYDYAQTGGGAHYEPIYAMLNNPEIETRAGQYLRPSADASKPSLYRADLDPVDVPALAGSRIWATFESYSFVAPSDCILSLREFVAGTYTAMEADEGVLIFEYDRSLGKSGGAGGVKQVAFAGFNAEANLEAGRRQDLKFPGLDPTDPYSPYLVATGSESAGPNGGIRLRTKPFPSDMFGVGIVQVLSDQGTPADNPRIQMDKLYHARYYVTSPVRTTSNFKQVRIMGQLNLRLQTANSAATAFLHFNGPANAENPQNATQEILAQAIPGIGSMNPETDAALDTPDEAGGWYSVIMNSPWNSDIRQDGNTFGTFADEPGPGVDLPSYKDITLGADVVRVPRRVKLGPAPYDSWPMAQPNNVNIRISRIELYEHDDVDDGGYGY